MFLKTHTPEQRLRQWRQLRHSANDISDVVEEFGQIKPENRNIDYYNPDSWPTVFEIVSYGLFCQSGITLVMAATMVNCGFMNHDIITLPVISNHYNGNTGLVLVNDSHVYNFLPGEVVSLAEAEKNSTQYEEVVINYDELFRLNNQ